MPFVQFHQISAASSCHFASYSHLFEGYIIDFNAALPPTIFQFFLFQFSFFSLNSLPADQCAGACSIKLDRFPLQVKGEKLMSAIP